MKNGPEPRLFYLICEARDRNNRERESRLSTTNIKEEIRKLTELQEVDRQIFSLIKERSEQPKIIEELQKEFDAKKAKLKSLEENRQKKQLKQKEEEVELGSKEENIKKANSQLGQLKTNKDYQLKLAEIESLKADKSIIEEEILKLMDEIDLAKKEIEAEKKTLEDEEKRYNEKKNALTRRGKEIEGLLKDFEGKRKILSDSIDKKILTRYEHILQGKEGLAIVKVQDNSCQGCFMKVPPQVINEIKMHEHVITCEICARILYLEEDI